MKKYQTHWILVLAFMLLFTGSALADKLTYKFDLVKIDVNHLIEAPGDMTITINFPDELEDVWTKQYLQDIIDPILIKGRNDLSKMIRDTNKKLDSVAKKNFPGKKKKQRKRLRQALRKKIIAPFNAEYKQMLSDIEKEVDTAIDNGWKEIVKKDKEYRRFKWSLGISSVSEGFKIAWKGLNAYFSGGATLTKDLPGIIKSCISIYEALEKGYQDEADAREGVKEALDNLYTLNMEPGIKEWADAGGKEALEGRALALIQDKAGEADEAIETYENKLTYIRQQAQALSKNLDSLLDEQENMVSVISDADIEGKINDLIQNVEGFSATLTDGNKLVDTAKQTVLLAKAKRIDIKFFSAVKQTSDIVERLEGLKNLAEGEDLVDNGIELLAWLLDKVNKAM